MNRRRFLRGAASAALVLPSLRTLAGSPGAVLVERFLPTMGTIASLSVYAEDARAGEAAIDAVAAEFRSVERSMSSHDPSSGLNAVNRAAGGDAVAASPDVAAAVAAAGAFFGCTAGAFDPTVGPLLELYGFFDGRAAGPAPSDREIATRLEAVGFGNVEVDAVRSTVRLRRPGSRIDLGGIGVGIALDRAVARLRARGVESALVNHSGDIAALGAPPESEGWDIAVQDPFDARGTIATYTLRDRFVSTSGNYEEAVMAGPERIGHILDPHTGRNPSSYAAVTVFADSGVAADALSTGFFAGGVRLAAPPPSGSGRISALTVSADGGRPATGFFPDVRA